MKLHYVSNVFPGLASFRYRILLPSQHLSSQGHEVFINETFYEDADIVFFNKHFEPESHLALLKRYKQANIPTVFDICDNHFQTQHQAHYYAMTEHADYLSCNTGTMQEIIREHTGKEACVIADPFELPQGQPKTQFGDTLHLMWFGHAVNFATLIPLAEELTALSKPFSLHLVTLGNIPEEVIKALKVLQEKNPALQQVQAHPWSLKSMPEIFAAIDIAVLPTILDDKTKYTKSANRLLECLQSGRFVCAHGLPSYQEFADYVHIGNIAEGITWAINHPEALAEKLSQGQAYVNTHYAPDAIGEVWQSFFADVLEK